MAGFKQAHTPQIPHMYSVNLDYYFRIHQVPKTPASSSSDLHFAPSYLTDKLSLRPNKGLRSDNQLLLNVPVSTLRLKFYGYRAFSVAGPTLWNALPKNIRLCATLAAFKISLKTYLFKKVYKV